MIAVTLPELKIRIFATFQELPSAIPLNSEKLSLFSDSERSEESKALIIKSFRNGK